MPQLFPPVADTFVKVAIVAVAAAAVVFFPLRSLVIRSPYITGIGRYQQQPFQFSHLHHVGEVGIDCRYCHTSVEKSGFAGIPSTNICMQCHSQILKDSAMLEPVRESLARHTPLSWIRVHTLPDYVFFNHSIHLAKGIGCESCHGRVDQMPSITKHLSLTMRDCLDCHRNPEQHVRPKEELFSFGREEPNRGDVGVTLAREYKIGERNLTDCMVCHR